MIDETQLVSVGRGSITSEVEEVMESSCVEEVMESSARRGPVTRSQTKALKAACGGERIALMVPLVDLSSSVRKRFGRGKSLLPAPVCSKPVQVVETFDKEGARTWKPYISKDVPSGKDESGFGFDSDFFSKASELFAQKSLEQMSSFARGDGSCLAEDGGACSSPKSVLETGQAEEGDGSREKCAQDVGSAQDVRSAPVGKEEESGQSTTGQEGESSPVSPKSNTGESFELKVEDGPLCPQVFEGVALAATEERLAPAQRNGSGSSGSDSASLSSQIALMSGQTEKGACRCQAFVDNDECGELGLQGDISELDGGPYLEDVGGFGSSSSPALEVGHAKGGVVLNMVCGKLAVPTKEEEDEHGTPSPEGRSSQVLMEDEEGSRFFKGGAIKEGILSANAEVSKGAGTVALVVLEEKPAPGLESASDLTEDSHTSFSSSLLLKSGQAEKGADFNLALVELASDNSAQNRLAGSKRFGGFLDVDLEDKEEEEVQCRMHELMYHTVFAIFDGEFPPVDERLQWFQGVYNCIGDGHKVMKVDHLGRGCFEVLLSESEAVAGLLKQRCARSNGRTCFFYRWQPGFTARAKEQLHVPLFSVELHVADVPSEFFCRPILKRVTATVGELEDILGRCEETGDVKLRIQAKGGVRPPDRLCLNGFEMQIKVEPGHYACEVCRVVGHGLAECAKFKDHQSLGVACPTSSSQESDARAVQAEEDRTSIMEVGNARAYVDVLRGSCSKSASAEGEHVPVKELECRDTRVQQPGQVVKPGSSAVYSDERQLVELQLSRAGDGKMLAYWDRRVGYSFVKFFCDGGAYFPMAVKNFLAENVGWRRRNFFIQMHNIEHVHNMVVLHAEMTEHVRCYSPRGPLAWVPGEEIYCGSYG